MTERQRISPHPLDGCDDDDCYKTMMAERTVLVAAQREAQDNLIKTIIQLSSALIALMAGFVSQDKVNITGISLCLFSIAIGALITSIVSGMAENFYSSRAYKEQQNILEDYYGRYTSTFEEAASNKPVRRAQVFAFSLFVLALLSLGTFAIIEAKGSSNAKRQPFTASTTASTTAAAASTTTAAAASTTAASTSTAADWGQCIWTGNKVSRTKHAAAAAEKGRLTLTFTCIR